MGRVLAYPLAEVSVSEDSKAIRDLTNGFNEFREENRGEHRSMSSRFDKLESRVTALETEGLSSVALTALKHIDQRLDEHIKGESEWRESLEKRQDDFGGQLTQIANNTAQTSNVLSALQADMARQGRNAGAQAGAAITIGVPTVIAVVYATLQYLFGG